MSKALAVTGQSRGTWLKAGAAALALGAAVVLPLESADARPMFFPHGGGFHGGFHGGYGGYRGGYGGWHRGYGYGLGGLGVGLALGGLYGAYGAGYGYAGYPYGGYGYGAYPGCLRRVWGPYGPHWVNVCY